MPKKYLFKSERLGFRNWLDDDLMPFAEICADPEVMAHFPKTLSVTETEALIQRCKMQYEEKGYTYYAVDLLSSSELIGFIGMAYQTYEAPFLPATDIGWRLKKTAWGNGYATEGAQRCLSYALNDLKLERIVSVCTLNNKSSERVMQKIGMTRVGTFKHPKLKDYPEHEECVWYRVDLKIG